MKDTFLKSSNKAGHFPFLGITELFTLVHIKLQQNPHTDYRAVAGWIFNVISYHPSSVWDAVIIQLF